jgi:ABC-type polysaccharide/polyol phosphate export permease
MISKKTKKKLTREKLAVAMSATTFAGAGQFVQKRYFAAITFCIPFLAAFCMVVVHFIRFTIFIFKNGYAEWDIFFAFTKWVLIALLIYGAGLIDTIHANKRTASIEQSSPENE